MAVEIIFAACSGRDVTRGAWAAWDADRQEWVLGDVFDDGVCQTCERDVTLRERTLLRVVGVGR